MEYKQETLSPIKLKYSVIVPATEVDDKIRQEINRLQKTLRLPGFRPGKAPASLLMKRFQATIMDEVRDALIEQNLDDILKKEKIEPLSNLFINKSETISQGNDFKWSFEYEILPEFELPEYKGLKGRIERVEVSSADVDRAMATFRDVTARKIPVNDGRPAVDGQIANIDIEILDNGKPMQEFGSRHYEFKMGSGDLLPELEILIKGIPVGNMAEKEIVFPSDFRIKELAGKTHTVRVKVNSVFDLDEAVWEERWKGDEGQKKLSEFRQLIQESQIAQKKEYAKGTAEAALLSQILEKVEFPVPQSLLDFEYKRILTEYNSYLHSRGLTLAALGDQTEKMLETSKKNAEIAARQLTALLAIARKENIRLEENELASAIENYSKENGEDFTASVRKLQESGMLNNLKNKLLADKAMTFIYENADLEETDPEAEK